jgi:hypothetical protein
MMRRHEWQRPKCVASEVRPDRLAAVTVLFGLGLYGLLVVVLLLAATGRLVPVM